MNLSCCLDIVVETLIRISNFMIIIDDRLNNKIKIRIVSNLSFMERRVCRFSFSTTIIISVKFLYLIFSKIRINFQ